MKETAFAQAKIALFLALVSGFVWSTCTLAPPASSSPIAPAVRQPESPALATTYYVRTDGGSTDECTGLADAAYPGSGTGQACAWDHPFRALPPDGAPRIAGGDTLIIASGSYMMGYDAPGADACESDYPWECHMPPIPSGPDAAHPTRILGVGWDAGCDDPPELWGTERSEFILNLTDASNAEIACLEITDHSGCVEYHTGGLACERDTYPYGDWASDGLYAEDSANVHLSHLDIHGLAVAGVRAGRLTDWTVEDVRIAGNGWVGWEGDIDGDDSNSGTLTFRRWAVAWNGCGETYPDGQPAGCWAQSAGGYGDGVGTGTTGGNWVIEDSIFLRNTSDGLDLLYTREEGSSITIRRTVARGNAGDQIKTTGPTLIENVVAVSNCGFFDGKSFTHDVENCRAGGSAIALTFRAGDQITVVNSTITGQGDCLVIAECMEDQVCTDSESVLLRNDIFQGNPEFDQADDTTCLAWHGTTHDPFVIDYAIINGVKEEPAPCPSNSWCSVPPGLANDSIDAFDPHLLASSPAVDAGSDAVCPSTDYLGNARPVDGDGDGEAVCDIGAHEYGEAQPPVQAEFTASPLSGQPPLTVTFSNASSGTYSASLWDLGDGAISTQENPTHVYTTIGAYTVTLTISGTAGSDTEVKEGYITVWEVASRVHLPLTVKDWSTPSRSSTAPQVAGCDVFPVDNIWNTPVNKLPVHANSAAYVATIGAEDHVHADFGSGEWPPGSGSPIGIPYVDVPGTQPKVNVTFEYDDESDPGPYPIPSDAPIEGGPDSDGDRHVLVVDRDECILYELFYAFPQPGGSWTAGSGAIFDLNSHALRPAGWTSADAAGLPILPGLVRYDEVTAGEIRHALRFTAPQTQNDYVWPARHYASSLTGTQYPPMGQRFRLKADFDVSGFSPEVQVILQALKKYGMMLADNGSAWFISGAPDERWDNDILHEMHQIHGSDFEAVDVSTLQVNPDSGQAQLPTLALSLTRSGTRHGDIRPRLASTTTITTLVYLPLITSTSPDWWQPPANTTWQWQLTDLPVDQSFDVDMYDIDMFDNSASTVAALQAQGRKVICYVSVGSWEDWRPDADQFPDSVLGNDYEGWAGEKWLDIRQIDLLAPIMRARFDQCKAKGFDGIEPDNIDGYTNKTGFPLTYQDQLNYNMWLANEAHARGLSIGLKNDADQATDLLSYFDWAMTEDCYADEWCDDIAPFVDAGKAVFAAEYTDMLTTNEFFDDFCPYAETMNLSAILKDRDLDAWRRACS